MVVFSAKKKQVLGAVVGVGLFLFVGVAPAADIIKTNNADALNLGSSWAGLVVPGTNDRAIYKQTVSAYVNEVGADLSWKGIMLTNNTKAWTINGSNTLTLGANGIDMAGAGANLTINSPVNLGVAQAWAVANSRTLTIGGVISGAFGNTLTKNGAGTLMITNTSNNYGGGTIVNAGTLTTDGNDNPLGTGAVTLNDGTFLSLGANGVLTNAVTIPAGQNTAINGNATLNSPISGSGSLTHGASGAFKLILGGDNSGFSGNITNTATISLKHKNALGTGTLYMKDDSTLAANANLLGFNAITNNIVLLNANIAKLGAISSTGEFELKGVISGSGSLIANHPLVTVALGGANTYTNTTDISQGGLIINGSMKSRLITAAAGTTLGGTGMVQAVTMNSGSILTTTSDNTPGTLTFKGDLTLVAGSTNRMKVFSTNSYDILKGAGTNTLLAGGIILLDFNYDVTVAAGDQFNVFQLFTNWSNVTKGAGLSLATIGLPGSLTVAAPSFPTNGIVTVILSPSNTPITLPDKYPISMTYHGPSPGTNTLANELLKYEPMEILGGVADGVWDTVRATFPNKIVLKQDAWGGTVSVGMQSAWPGHWLLKTGTKLSANCSASDTVLHVQDYSRLATSQAAVNNVTNDNRQYLLIYGLDGSGQPDWSRAEHLKIKAVDTVNRTITVERAQQGSLPLAFTNNQAVIAQHMMFWVNTPGGQWQLNFSLQCPRGGPLNLTAAEWFARQMKSLIDTSGADGVEFDVARWEWGGLAGNTMDCNNDLITDYGYIDGVQSFGLGGQLFVRELRTLLGPGKIIQMDSGDVGQQRGWQYVNGCQMESFPNANNFPRFSQAFLHLRQYRDNITSLPNFSYAYVKTPTTTYENLYGTDGSNLDWHFRVGFAAGLLTGMPSPFSSIADPSFDPGEPGTNTYVASTATGDIFKWDEYFGGDLNDWQWLGQPKGAAVQILDNLGSSNLLNQAVWTWKTETNFGFGATCLINGGEYTTVITNLASVTNILPGSSPDYYYGTTVPKTLRYGVRLEAVSGVPAFEVGREYTLEFEAQGNDHWDYAGQTFDKVPRAISILSPQTDNAIQLLVNSNWAFYRLSFVAATNSPQLVFGCSEQVGSAGIRNIRLYQGGGERWVREFTTGIVLLNMTKQPWAYTTPTAYRRLSGPQNPDINNGQRVPPSVTVPVWDALFLVKTAGTNIIVPVATTFDFSPGGLVLGSNDSLSGWGVVTGNVNAVSGAMIYPGTSGPPTGTLSFSNNLTLNGQTLSFDLTSNPNNGNDRIVVAGSVTNIGNTTISLNYLNGFLEAGTYTLMTYASRQGGVFVLDTNYSNVTINVGATSLTLTVGAGGSVGAPLVWHGDGLANLWDIATSANWLYQGQPTVFSDGAGVLFNDSTANFTVNLNTNVSPGSVTVNATNNYAFTGTGGIDGAGSLTKDGSGRLTLSATNIYSGGTTIAAGTLQAINPASVPGNVTNDGVLAFNTTLAGTFAGNISGTGSLTKDGNVNLTLTGNNSFSGNITIMSGSGNSLTVASAANLGSGTNITINQNANLKTTGTFATSKNIKFNLVNCQISPAVGTVLTLNGLCTDTGNANPQLSGAGTLVLNASNNFTPGVTFLAQGGSSSILALGHSNALNGVMLRFNGSQHLDNFSGADMTTAGQAALRLTSGFTFDGTKSLDMSGCVAGFEVTTNSTRTITVTSNILTIAGIRGAGSSTVGTNTVTWLDGGLTKAGGGTLILSGPSDYTGNSTVNAGILLVNGAMGSSVVVVKTNATLGGNGVIEGPLTVESGGALQPGSGGTNIATLTVSNVVNLSGATILVLNRAGVPNSSRLAVTGTLAAGGVLTITNVGEALQAGDTFTLFSPVAPSGSFSATNLPALGTNLVWNTSQLGTNGTMAVVSTVTNPPRFYAPVRSGASLILSGTNGSGPNYYVLSTTNVKLPRTSWTVLATNYFGPGGWFNFTNPINPDEPNRFFILQLP